MIKPLKKWLEDTFDFAKVAYPACVWVNLSFDVECYSE